MYFKLLKGAVSYGQPIEIEYLKLDFVVSGAKFSDFVSKVRKTKNNPINGKFLLL